MLKGPVNSCETKSQEDELLIRFRFVFVHSFNIIYLQKFNFKIKISRITSPVYFLVAMRCFNLDDFFSPPHRD